MSDTSANQSSFDTGADNPVATSTTAALDATWTMLGMSYASAGATPRFHRYRFDTAVATHENGHLPLTAPPAHGANGQWRIGFSDGDSWGGQIAAAGYWRHDISDTEFEGMAAGEWASTAPRFLWESSARDTTMAWARDLSRMKAVFVSATATTRYAGSDPPGFRFSAANRRR